MYVDAIRKKKDLVPSFFPCKFFFDPASLHCSEFFLEDEVHLSISIEERHIERYSSFFLVSVVFIVSIGDHEFSVFDDPELFCYFIYKISIMRDKKYRSFIVF